LTPLCPTTPASVVTVEVASTILRMVELPLSTT